MTTRDPGASDVLTHGFERRPRLTAFSARSPAASITCGVDVFVQLVIAAITTWPSATSMGASLSRCAVTVRNDVPAPLFREADASACLKPDLVSDNDTRSWGRDGPARLGSTVDRSSTTNSENTGSVSALRWKRPCSLA